MTGSHVGQFDSAVGKVGRYGFEKPALLNQRVGKLSSKDRSKLSNDFLYYLISQTEVQFELATNAGGSANQANISPDLIRSLEFDIPNLESQTRIASILSALDDKIELNRRMNRTLEQMAETLFKKYFVDDIDPENLPEGWRWGVLSDIVSIKHGYAFQGAFFSEEPNDNLLLTPGNFKIGGGFNYGKFKYYKGDISAEYVLEKGDLIVTMTDLSKDGDTLGYSALVPSIHGKNLLHNQRIGKVQFLKSPELKYYLNWLMRTNEFRAFILGSATGSTVKHTSPTRICEYRCLIPGGSLIEEFNKTAKAVFEKEINNNSDTIFLTQIRDILLPKLMNGEIEVS